MEQSRFTIRFQVVGYEGSDKQKFTEFPLPINPSSLNHNENFAVSIKPSQGGTVVNHNGVRYGDITLTGTTGVYPFAGMAGASSGSIFVKDTSNLKNKSGYEVFHLLKNYLKVYYEAKATKTEAVNARLVFKNYKDGEFLVVEILKFTMDRNLANRTFYDYNIVMRVIGREEKSEAKVKLNLFGILDKTIGESARAAVAFIDAGRALMARTQEIAQNISGEFDKQVTEPMRKMSVAFKAIAGISLSLADINKQAFNKYKSQAIDLDESFHSWRNTDIGDVLDEKDVKEAVDESQSEVKKLNPARLKEIIRNITRVAELIENEYAKYPNANKYDLLKGLESCKNGLYIFLSKPEFFKNEYEQEISRVQSEFNNNLEIIPNNSMKQINIKQGDSLERIALRELRNAERWPELAVLNNLKNPYIVDGVDKIVPFVKKVGDLLLIPQAESFGFSEVDTINESIETKNLTEIEKNQGVDLKFDLNETNDLVLNNRGDLDISVGLKNSTQAIIIKLLLEQGDLLDYPELGSNLVIGRRNLRAQDVRDSISKTLVADARFERLSNLSVIREGGTMRISFEVYLKRVDVPIPISFEVVT